MSGALMTRRSSAPSSWAEPRRFLDDMENRLIRLWEDGQDTWFGGGATPLLDISETDTAIEAKLDLPGVESKEIEIQLHGNTVTVSGERKEEKEEKGKTYYRAERSVGSFSRSFSLPCPVEEDAVVAAYNDGVLTITLPKTEEAKTRKIEVKS